MQLNECALQIGDEPVGFLRLDRDVVHVAFDHISDEIV